jgi:hypothetical protein
MNSPGPTPRSTLHRLPDRARYDRATIDAILDEGLVCHVGFLADGHPCVIPMNYARSGDRLYLHGSGGSRMLRALAEGAGVCVTVTLLDGLVLARSAFNHSMNYRSVVILGKARELTDRQEKLAALAAFMDHVLPGREASVRGPSESELRGTRVLEVPIHEASAKLRTGPPKDDPEDLGRDCWAGVIPLRLVAGEPCAAPDLRADLAIPDAVRNYARGAAG